jgi:hypothetical protein
MGQCLRPCWHPPSHTREEQSWQKKDHHQQGASPMAGLEYVSFIPSYLSHSSCLFTVNAAKKVDPKVLLTLENLNVLKDGDDDMAANVEKIYQVDYNTREVKEIFGINYKIEKDSAMDMIAEFGKTGW